MITPQIAVAGLGYVGLANACLLANHNAVLGVDVSAARVALINKRISPIEDAEVEAFPPAGRHRLEASSAACEHAHHSQHAEPVGRFPVEDTRLYAPEHDKCLARDDAEVGIAWPNMGAHPACPRMTKRALVPARCTL